MSFGLSAQGLYVNLLLRRVASQSTHIISSRGLNGFKTHKIQTRKGSVVHVVKPEWILDSLSIGKRQPERRYTVLRLSEGIFE